MSGPYPEPSQKAEGELVPPPEVPEEFAAAYRAAYEQAMAAQSVALPAGEHADPGEDEDDESGLPRRTRPIAVGTHRLATEYDDDSPTLFERVRDSGWLVPSLLAVLALLLVASAYVVGKAFAGRVGHRTTAQQPQVVMGEGRSAQQPEATQSPVPGAWDGPVTALRGVRASAGCTAKPGQDAAGAAVSYAAANLTDGAADTTWRCDAPGIGQVLRFNLGRRVDVGEVGLLPGYAKTDARDGTDRYAENNRVTKVRWTIGGTVVDQSLSGDPKDRSVRLIRVPRTPTNVVTLRILGVAHGARDATAISEVRIAKAS